MSARPLTLPELSALEEASAIVRDALVATCREAGLASRPLAYGALAVGLVLVEVDQLALRGHEGLPEGARKLVVGAYWDELQRRGWRPARRIEEGEDDD